MAKVSVKNGITVLNLNQMIDKQQFSSKAKKNKMIEVVGACWTTEAGWYDRQLKLCRKDYQDKQYTLIKLQRGTSVIDVGFTRKQFLKNGTRFGKLIGYVQSPSCSTQYVAVMEKPAKEIVAVEVVKAFYAKHKISYNEKISVEEMKQIVATALAGTTSEDSNLRHHLNFTKYENLPLEYQYVEYFPFVVEKGESIIAVAIDNFYFDVSESLQAVKKEYWVSEASKERRLTKESKMQAGKMSESEMFGYLDDCGILSRVFPECKHGQSGKSGIRKKDGVIVKMTDIHHREYTVPYAVNFESDAVIEMDRLGYSSTIGINRRRSNFLYLPQVRNNPIALDIKDKYLSHKYNTAIWYDKDTVYFLFLEFDNLKDFTDCRIVDAKAFTFNKETADAFHYYSPNGKKLYRKKDQTCFEAMVA